MGLERSSSWKPTVFGNATEVKMALQFHLYIVKKAINDCMVRTVFGFATMWEKLSV